MLPSAGDKLSRGVVLSQSTFHLVLRIWQSGLIYPFESQFWRSRSQVKVHGHRMKRLFFGYICTLQLDVYLVFCRVLSAKVDGATSGEGFLVRSFSCLLFCLRTLQNRLVCVVMCSRSTSRSRNRNSSVTVTVTVTANWTQFRHFVKVLTETAAQCSTVGRRHKNYGGVYNFLELYRIVANDIQVP